MAEPCPGNPDALVTRVLYRKKNGLAVRWPGTLQINGVTHQERGSLDPGATLVPSAQNPADDKDGMRDFSPETVLRRRRDGFKFAHDILLPAFEDRWQ